MSFTAIAVCVIAGMLLLVVAVAVQSLAISETKTNGSEDEGEHKE